MRFVKNLSSQSASGLLQTLVGKPVIRRSKIQDEFDRTMRQAFKDSLSKATTGSEEDRVDFLVKGLMDLAKAVSAPKNAEFESKHVRAQGGRFGSKPKANETSDESQGPDLTDPKVAKKAWEDRLALGEVKEDFEALKTELEAMADAMNVNDHAALAGWIVQQRDLLFNKIENAVDRAKMNEYHGRVTAFEQAPDKLDSYVTLLREAAKYDYDNSDVGFPGDEEGERQDREVVQPHRRMLRRLSAEFVAKGAAQDPTFPRFVLEKYIPPHEVLDRAETYVNAVNQLHLKGSDLEAQEFIVKSAKETMQEFDAYDPDFELSKTQVNVAWDAAAFMMNYYAENGPHMDANILNGYPQFDPNSTGNAWDRVFKAVIRASIYTIGDWFGNAAAWYTSKVENWVAAGSIPTVDMRFMAKTFPEHITFFGKAMEHHRNVYGEDETFNAAKAAFAVADHALAQAQAATAGDKWGQIATGEALEPAPFLDFYTKVQPMVRPYIRDMVNDDLMRQGPDNRRETFQTAFEGVWKLDTLASVAKNTGNDLSGAETILRTAEEHEFHAIMGQVLDSWDEKEHSTFKLVPNAIFVVDKFAKHEVGFKQWAEQKDHVGEFYHGTAHAAAPLILSGGLRVPKKQQDVKTGAMFGQGIYLAPNASKSAQYGDTSFSRGEGTGVLIGVKASLGQIRDVIQSGDYAPKPHGIGPVTNFIGDALTIDEYDQIKDTIREPFLMVNDKDSGYVFAAHYDVTMARRPTLTQYKRQGDKLIPMGNFPITKPAPTSNPKKDALLLMENAGKMIQDEYPNIKFDPTYGPVDSAMAYVKGSTTPFPLGKKVFVSMDRKLDGDEYERLPIPVKENAHMVVAKGDKLWVVVRRPEDKQYMLAQWTRLGSGNDSKLISTGVDFYIPPEGMTSLGALRSGMAQALVDKMGAPPVSDFATDHFATSASGYDSVRGLSSANGGMLKNDEIVVFEEAQVVPDYVISYTRRRKEDY